jgi:CRP-like cAMP-binding protein
MRIGDSLLALGEVQRAAVVYTSLAKHAAHMGYPLRALSALKVLEALEPQLGQLLAGVAALYSVESTRLGRAVRMSLADLDRPLPAGWSPEPAEPAAVIERAEEVGSRVPEGFIFPEKLPPVPLFSELPAEAFAAVLAALKLKRMRSGEVILRQGDEGQAFYVLARGSVTVTRQPADPAAPPVTLASLHDGAIFGEMALVSAAPRSATVTAETDCDLLEFDGDALRAAAAEAQTIGRALDTFTRQRLLQNLLATARLFQPLDRKQRLDLVRRFRAHELEAGADIVREGQPGEGLFVVLSGEVDVWKRDGDEKVLLASLGPGEVFGEISLLHEEPATATVTAAGRVTVLFLAREYFQRLVAAVPAIREYVEELGENRQMDTRILMDREPGDEVVLSEDDLIMI